jgi:DNA-binding XRE family transcriptional regulator
MMETIRIEGEAGIIRFEPSHISHAKLLKIEKGLRKLMEASEDYISTREMRAILKKRDPLIGTPGGAIRGYRAREGLTQIQLAKKAGLMQGHLSAIERNKRSIGVKVAKRLAKALRCDYRRFL